MLMFALAVILSLFLISGVCAHECADDSVLQNDEEYDFTSIQTLIDNANDGDAIVLNANTYFGDGTPIIINKTVIINGNDAILDAQGKSNIFVISKNANLTLNKLTLTNGNAKNGGAIYNNGILAIDDCNLNSNSASNAGVLYNYGSSTITNSKFMSNSAANGAAIISNSNLIVLNCEFVKNKISHSYGVISIDRGMATILNSTFKNNGESDEGSCIFNRKPGNVTVRGSKFIQNRAYSYAGAINNDGTMLIEDSIFDTNIAYGAGAVDNGGKLTIINSNFTKNSATKNGGAIDTKGNLEVVNCNFDSNVAGREGGAIIARGDIKVSRSSFTLNSAGVADAIYINDDIEYSINDIWWGSDSPDFSKLININLTEDSGEIVHSSSLYAPNMTTSYGLGDELTITLKDDEDNPIKNEVISVKIDGKSYNLTTDNNGQANFKIDFSPNTYIAEISYGGSDLINGSKWISRIVVNESSSQSGESDDTSFEDNSTSQKPMNLTSMPVERTILNSSNPTFESEFGNILKTSNDGVNKSEPKKGVVSKRVEIDEGNWFNDLIKIFLFILFVMVSYYIFKNKY